MKLSVAVIALSLAGCVTDETLDDEPGDEESLGKGDSPNSADNPKVPSGTAAQFPIVLVHGFNATPEHNGFGPEVVAALCHDGHSVFAPALPPFASSETRSAVLAVAVEDVLAGATDDCGNTPAVAPLKVNLIAHSMGGLDVRALPVRLGFGDRIATITTMSSPHHGTAMADMMLGLTANLDDQALDGLAALLARPLSDNPTQLDSDLRAAFTSLAEANSEAFAMENPDDPRVTFESWAGLSNVAGIPNAQDVPACEGKMALFPASQRRHRMHIAFKPIAVVVAHQLDLRPNDGLIQVASSKWGTFRGCIPSDHADEVNAFAGSRFDHIRFLRNRAFELAARGN